MGLRACLTFPSPSALYHVLSRALPAQLWPLPTGASGPSAPTPAAWQGRRPQALRSQTPVFPVLPHFQPLTHSRTIYTPAQMLRSVLPADVSVLPAAPGQVERAQRKRAGLRARQIPGGGPVPSFTAP